ncbi:hypothetical protein AJ80_02260 [Polytolypa hystricis UAMH7299]|uniref:Uncharacterized protein n=1 Tax=Polytolypa hystricis (strain UAMH7299) TaxID=1447883 RepID=A0A2B7YHT4_POLH7|nr:hypothetical protein AJ80_02260 [Polytolypa hystricis UAMH7299]
MEPSGINSSIDLCRVYIAYQRPLPVFPLAITLVEDDSSIVADVNQVRGHIANPDNPPEVDDISLIIPSTQKSSSLVHALKEIRKYLSTIGIHYRIEFINFDFMQPSTFTVFPDGPAVDLWNRIHKEQVLTAIQNKSWQSVNNRQQVPHNAAESINWTLDQNNVIFLPLDLCSFEKIRSFVKNMEIQELSANLLARPQCWGAMSIPRGYCARIVVTVGGTHDPAQRKETRMLDANYTAAEELVHPLPETTAKNDGRQRHTFSKLPRVLLRVSHARQLGTKDLFWLHLMPCMIPVLRLLASHNIHTPKESGAAFARLAVGKNVKGGSGVYYEGMRRIDSSKDSYNEGFQEDLWNWTVKTVAMDEEAGVFEVVEEHIFDGFVGVRFPACFPSGFSSSDSYFNNDIN